MEAIKAGETSALEALYSRYARNVLGLCRRVLGDVRDAEEVMLETFVQIWQHGDRYDASRASPLAYLFTVARSRAIDRLRAQGRHRVVSAATDDGILSGLERVELAAASPLARLLSAETRGRVEAALAQLAPEQREALELAYFQDLSHREAAERLGLPLGTLKTRIRQGLLRLRDGLVRDVTESEA
jgi:RNA polymerase sigma-70 factor (ECF subfamily)